jgi:hypothetical protein
VDFDDTASGISACSLLLAQSTTRVICAVLLADWAMQSMKPFRSRQQSRLSTDTDTDSGETRPQTQATDLSRMSHKTNDLFETELQECIASTSLREVYLQFAVKEFTTGARAQESFPCNMRLTLCVNFREHTLFGYAGSVSCVAAVIVLVQTSVAYSCIRRMACFILRIY